MSTQNNVNRLARDLKKEAQQRAERVIQKVRPQFQKNLGDILEARMTNIFKEVVDDFYSKYHPTFYNRDYRLKYLLKIKKTIHEFSYDFDETKLSYRNGYNGEDGLYATVFQQGWHGGAQLGGKMLVPYLRPAEKYNGTKIRDGVTNAKWQSPYNNTSSYWKKAIQAEISPLDNFIQKKEKYEKELLQQDAQKAWDDAMKQYRS